MKKHHYFFPLYMEALSCRGDNPSFYEGSSIVKNEQQEIEHSTSVEDVDAQKLSQPQESDKPQESDRLPAQDTVETSIQAINRILIQGTPDDLTESILVHTLRQKADFGTQKVQKGIHHYFEVLEQNAEDPESFVSLITRLSARADAAGGLPDGRWHEVAQAALGEQADLADEWGVDNAAGTIERNLATTLYLEKAAPGAVHYLREEYGIQHFGRYPAQMLLDMFHRREETGPWGLTIFAKADHNDAFYYSEPLAQMHSEVGDAFTTRIIECDSVTEVRRLMARLAAKHGKAGFVIINAHGNPEGMRLGDDQDQVLTKEVINERFGFLIHECTEEGAGICLNSCSTGQQGAVSEHIAASSGKQTSAPTTDTAVQDYGAEIRGNTIHFNPKYHDGSTRTVAADNGSAIL